MVPTGAALDYAIQGDWEEAGVSLLGDAAFGLGAVVKVYKGGRVALVAEGAVGIYRSGQTVYFAINEDYTAAAGTAGEALLRLFGVSSSVLKQLKKTNKPVDKLDDVPGAASKILRL